MSGPLLGRGLYVDVTLEKLDERVPKVQCGPAQPRNLSGKRTETKKAPLLCPMGRPAGVFSAMFSDRGACSTVCFLFRKGEGSIMLESLEAALYPIVVNINTYLSSYILVFLLIGVGLVFTASAPALCRCAAWRGGCGRCSAT